MSNPVAIEMELLSNPDNTISVLEDKLLTSIFNYLPVKDLIRIERVCKRWRDVSRLTWPNRPNELSIHFERTPSLKTRIWRLLRFVSSIFLPSLFNSKQVVIYQTELDDRQKVKMKFSASARTIDTTNCVVSSILQRCGQHLTHLNFIFKNVTYDENIFDVVSAHCPELRELDLYYMNLTVRGAKGMIDLCKRIEWLRIGFLAGDIDENGIAEIFESNEGLVGFSASYQPQITGVCFGKIKSEKFESLEISCCDNLDLSHLKNSELIANNLKSFFLESKDEGVLAHLDVVCTWKNLTKFVLYSYEIGVTDRLLVDMSRNCPLLEELDVELYTDVVDSDVTIDFDIETLDLDPDDDLRSNSGLISILNMPRLRSLSLVAQLNVRCDVWSKRQRELSNLEKLCLCEWKLTDNDIFNIVKVSPLLKMLTLEDCLLPVDDDFKFLNKLSKTVNERSSETKLEFHVKSKNEVSLLIIFDKKSYTIMVDLKNRFQRI